MSDHENVHNLIVYVYVQYVKQPEGMADQDLLWGGQRRCKSDQNQLSLPRAFPGVSGPTDTTGYRQSASGSAKAEANKVDTNRSIVLTTLG